MAKAEAVDKGSPLHLPPAPPATSGRRRWPGWGRALGKAFGEATFQRPGALSAGESSCSARAGWVPIEKHFGLINRGFQSFLSQPPAPPAWACGLQPSRQSLLSRDKSSGQAGPAGRGALQTQVPSCRARPPSSQRLWPQRLPPGGGTGCPREDSLSVVA